jgi:Acetyltransferase (GNAT) domain
MKLQVDEIPLEAVTNVPEWGAAVRETGCPIFYSAPFLTCMARAPLLPVKSASLLLVRGECGLVAGVPIFWQSAIDPIRHLARLYDAFADLPSSAGLLGHCWHCYDTRIVARQGPAVGARRLIQVLASIARKHGAPYAGLVNVSDGPTLEAMAAVGATPRYMVDRYVMDIAGVSSFDDYVAQLHPDARRELARQYRRFRESGAALAIEGPPFDDVEEVVTLCRRTAARYDAEFYYPAEETLYFLANMGEALRLISIRTKGERVGVLICFYDRPRFHIWAAGMRYDGLSFSPYMMSVAEAIRFAIDEGMDLIEGGRGNGRIKLKQGFVPRRLHGCLMRT